MHAGSAAAAGNAAYSWSRDLLNQLDERMLLEVVEGSCVYPKTSSMKEALQQAVVEASYSDAATFTEAVKAVKMDPHLKRLGFSLSIPSVMDALVALYDLCLLGTVDTVVLHHGGSVIVRFVITEVRMRAAAALTHAKAKVVDQTLPVVLMCVTVVASVCAAVLSSYFAQRK
jgi:hypothetical protein